MTLVHQTYKILLVEDDNTTGIGLMSELQEYYGVSNIVWTHTGEAAIELLKKDVFQVAMLDISLPGISGLEVLAWLRNQFDKQGMAVIILTQSRDAFLEELAYTIGTNLFMTKPIDMAELADHISHMILMGV